MKFIVGKKVEMTQVWRDDKVVAVTKVQCGPCTVTQVKNEKTDGYEAVQISFEEKKLKNTKKPQKGHLKDLPNARHLKEFRAAAGELKKGDVITVDTFAAGDTIDVIGTSKGKGFQGVVKRHGFAGTKATHGNKDQLRMPGSIGATGPAHVFKGTRMGGRTGGDRVTMKNLEVVEVDLENNIILIKGAVPGARNSLVMLNGEGELKFTPAAEAKVEESKPEEKEESVEVNKDLPKEKTEEKTEEKKEEVKEESVEANNDLPEVKEEKSVETNDDSSEAETEKNKIKKYK